MLYNLFQFPEVSAGTYPAFPQTAAISAEARRLRRRSHKPSAAQQIDAADVAVYSMSLLGQALTPQARMRLPLVSNAAPVNRWALWRSPMTPPLAAAFRE